MLDEPTNHLDFESVQALTQALEDYEGTVILVTHNEAMLSKIAKRLVLFDNGEVQLLDYGYDKFLAKGGWCEEDEAAFKASRGDSEQKKIYFEEKERRKQQIILKKQIEKIEREIEKLEKGKVETSNALNEACIQKDVEAIKKLGIRLKETEDLIDLKYTELEKKMEEVTE